MSHLIRVECIKSYQFFNAYKSYLHDGSDDRECQNAPPQRSAIFPHNNCPDRNATSCNEANSIDDCDSPYIRIIEMRSAKLCAKAQLYLLAPGRIIERARAVPSRSAATFGSHDWVETENIPPPRFEGIQITNAAIAENERNEQRLKRWRKSHCTNTYTDSRKQRQTVHLMTRYLALSSIAPCIQKPNYNDKLVTASTTRPIEVAGLIRLYAKKTPFLALSPRTGRLLAQLAGSLGGIVTTPPIEKQPLIDSVNVLGRLAPASKW